MLQNNEYFDGNVKSIGFQTASLPATIGVMAIGEYTFGTGEKETMTVVNGALKVKLPGSSEWQLFNAGESFTIAANQSFDVEVTVETAYLCLYG